MLRAPYLTDESIRVAAEGILDIHQPDRAIPIDIEDLIEFGLEMEIRPVRGLHARYQFEGALSHDLSTILVDEDRMLRHPSRYRFTLAHELGHRVLHANVIGSLELRSSADWKAAVASIDPSEYGWLERQAYSFAGHILVPLAALEGSIRDAQMLALSRGIDLTEMDEGAMAIVAGAIAKEYRVSTDVVIRQLRKVEWFGPQ